METDTTVYLVLASEELTASAITCAIHETEHGSDHRAINTVFDISTPSPKQPNRLLLKDAPWKEINARIEYAMGTILLKGTMREKTDKLMSVVLEAYHYKA